MEQKVEQIVEIVKSQIREKMIIEESEKKKRKKEKGFLYQICILMMKD